MTKITKQYVCNSCGAVYSRWAGKCEACGNWNCITEETITPTQAPKNTTFGKNGKLLEFVDLKTIPEEIFRFKSNIKELDRVCGGGIVPASVILVGGDPGIGKSTLLLQVVAALSQSVNKKGNPIQCVYISGEESTDQVRLRANRLQVNNAPIDLASSTSLRDIVATLNEKNPDIVVIDSVQTLFSDMLESAPGTVSQVRAVALELIQLAKTKGFVLFLVGHVTKEGTLAGPRVLEHMVDTVLYFEGDRGHHFRILRSVKNRFGATDEIGVFEMTEQGLEEVANPSALFLAERQGNISGSCVFAGIEGTRPILVEIQSLIAPMSANAPRRAVVGADMNRLLMILAVLEARGNVAFGAKDVFLNVAGGLKITEPACDLAIATALLSAISQKPIPADMIILGEIGLSGEIRPIPQTDLRLKESEKLGFTKALLPFKNEKKSLHTNMKLIDVGHIKRLVEIFKNGI